MTQVSCVSPSFCSPSLDPSVDLAGSRHHRDVGLKGFCISQGPWFPHFIDEDSVLRSVMELAQGPNVTKCRVRAHAPKCCFQHFALYSLHWGVNRVLSRGTSCPALLSPVQSPPQTHCGVQVRNCVSNLIPKLLRAGCCAQ